ncbi:hypothetical protein PR048_003000 [Dryococelus australis]|uniref:Uncharacterized protein n=1 Tax=Dryococelus australis TaxID=614101 RepID=A0ABQ9IMU7_9NEOP|nr:hypothetical protein PR048_003000 [Dryococelus australis]
MNKYGARTQPTSKQLQLLTKVRASVFNKENSDCYSTLMVMSQVGPSTDLCMLGDNSDTAQFSNAYERFKRKDVKQAAKSTVSHRLSENGLGFVFVKFAGNCVYSAKVAVAERKSTPNLLLTKTCTGDLGPRSFGTVYSDDAAGRRVLSGIFRFLLTRLLIPALLHTRVTSPSSAHKTTIRDVTLVTRFRGLHEDDQVARRRMKFAVATHGSYLLVPISHVAHFLRGPPACIVFSLFSLAEKCGRYKGYTGTSYKRVIAATRKALNWRAISGPTLDARLIVSLKNVYFKRHVISSLHTYLLCGQTEGMRSAYSLGGGKTAKPARGAAAGQVGHGTRTRVACQKGGRRTSVIGVPANEDVQLPVRVASCPLVPGRVATLGDLSPFGLLQGKICDQNLRKCDYRNLGEQCRYEHASCGITCADSAGEWACLHSVTRLAECVVITAIYVSEGRRGSPTFSLRDRRRETGVRSRKNKDRVNNRNHVLERESVNVHYTAHCNLRVIRSIVPLLLASSKSSIAVKWQSAFAQQAALLVIRKEKKNTKISLKVMVLKLSKPKDNVQQQVNPIMNLRSRCCAFEKATISPAAHEPTVTVHVNISLLVNRILKKMNKCSGKTDVGDIHDNSGSATNEGNFSAIIKYRGTVGSDLRSMLGGCGTDTKQHTSNVEQVAVCVRYVNSSCEIKEDLKGQELAVSILNGLIQCGIDCEHLIGQVYDCTGNRQFQKESLYLKATDAMESVANSFGVEESVKRIPDFQKSRITIDWLFLSLIPVSHKQVFDGFMSLLESGTTENERTMLWETMLAKGNMTCKTAIEALKNFDYEVFPNIFFQGFSNYVRSASFDIHRGDIPFFAEKDKNIYRKSRRDSNIDARPSKRFEPFYKLYVKYVANRYATDFEDARCSQSALESMILWWFAVVFPQREYESDSMAPRSGTSKGDLRDRTLYVKLQQFRVGGASHCEIILTSIDSLHKGQVHFSFPLPPWRYCVTGYPNPTPLHPPPFSSTIWCPSLSEPFPADLYSTYSKDEVDRSRWLRTTNLRVPTLNCFSANTSSGNVIVWILGVCLPANHGHSVSELSNSDWSSQARYSCSGDVPWEEIVICRATPRRSAPSAAGAREKTSDAAMLVDERAAGTTSSAASVLVRLRLTDGRRLRVALFHRNYKLFTGLELGPVSQDSGAPYLPVMSPRLRCVRVAVARHYGRHSAVSQTLSHIPLWTISSGPGGLNLEMVRVQLVYETSRTVRNVYETIVVSSNPWNSHTFSVSRGVPGNEKLAQGKLTADWTAKDACRLWEEVSVKLKKAFSTSGRVADKPVNILFRSFLAGCEQESELCFALLVQNNKKPATKRFHIAAKISSRKYFTARSWEWMKVIEVSMDQRRNERAGETESSDTIPTCEDPGANRSISEAPKISSINAECIQTLSVPVTFVTKVTEMLTRQTNEKGVVSPQMGVTFFNCKLCLTSGEKYCQLKVATSMDLAFISWLGPAGTSGGNVQKKVTDSICAVSVSEQCYPYTNVILLRSSVMTIVPRSYDARLGDNRQLSSRTIDYVYKNICVERLWVKRCREPKIYIKASERVNVDVFEQKKRPCPQHNRTQFFFFFYVPLTPIVDGVYESRTQMWSGCVVWYPHFKCCVSRVDVGYIVSTCYFNWYPFVPSTINEYTAEVSDTFASVLRLLFHCSLDREQPLPILGSTREVLSTDGAGGRMAAPWEDVEVLAGHNEDIEEGDCLGGSGGATCPRHIPAPASCAASLSPHFLLTRFLPTEGLVYGVEADTRR